MSDNAAAARALRADEYESRFLHPVESPLSDEPHRREPRQRAYGNRQHSAAPGTGGAAGPDAGVPGRRTIQITGQTVAPRRRSPTSTALVARPDRTAMWAFVLALFLVLMAVATAHAAVL
jgi:hypothetical protein